ncbi:MAG: hypothetical protein ACRDE7_06835, partial [Sphingobacterium sp.]
YMDALKDIPNNIDRIETHAGIAYLQKTDIFKKTMWFAYPRAESWVPLPVDKVREFAEINASGKKVADLVSPQQDDTTKEVVPDYENVVGQDSLTRLDEQNRRRRKKKPKKNNTNAGKPQSDSQKSQAKAIDTKQEPKKQAPGASAKPTKDPTNAPAAPKNAKGRPQNRNKRNNNNNRNQQGKSDN